MKIWRGGGVLWVEEQWKGIFGGEARMLFHHLEYPSRINHEIFGILGITNERHL